MSAIERFEVGNLYYDIILRLTVSKQRDRKFAEAVVKKLLRVSEKHWDIVQIHGGDFAIATAGGEGASTDKALVQMVMEQVQSPLRMVSDAEFVSRALFSEIYDTYLASLPVPAAAAAEIETVENQITDRIRTIVLKCEPDAISQLRFGRYATALHVDTDTD